MDTPALIPGPSPWPLPSPYAHCCEDKQVLPCSNPAQDCPLDRELWRQGEGEEMKKGRGGDEEGEGGEEMKKGRGRR